MHDPHIILILTTLLGAVGLWLMLPRGTHRGRSVGIILTAVALGAGASQLPYLGDWLTESIFGVLAAVTVVSAAATIAFRNPVYCAIWFGLTLLGTAGLFLFAGAQFLAVATIVVYAGAILVTFLFVLMLAQPEGKAAYDRVSWEALLSAVLGMVFVGVLSMAIVGVFTAPREAKERPVAPPAAKELAENVLVPQHVAALGTELFGKHLIAVEVAGALLLAALVGAAVIVAQGKMEEKNERNAQQKRD
ncbi:MAG: NADH-quinone oxidoreductase subunit J [Pirellulales bacterium]|nr:NADH-quinone oxidoreductase subunit J [Pirellulales bacterium]